LYKRKNRRRDDLRHASVEIFSITSDGDVIDNVRATLFLRIASAR